MIGESRLIWDLGKMALTMSKQVFKKKAASKDRHIIMLPGFSSDDTYMIPLGNYLKQLGYEAEGWGLGFNMAGMNYEAQIEDLDPVWMVEPKADYNGEASVPYLCDRAKEKILRRSMELDCPVTLIGWSLGGYVAREVARDLPDHVDQVITMGAPVIGGPKYTSAAALFKRKGMDLDWIAEEISKRERTLIQQPLTIIYSKTDAVVSWKAALDHHSPNTDHIEVNAAHLGMGFNQRIWKIIKGALAELD